MKKIVKGLTNLALVLIIVFLVIGLLKLFRRIFRFRVSVKDYDNMAKQVRKDNEAVQLVFITGYSGYDII